jgi:two-component system catabolic regulation response regulator CreB
MPSLLLIEDEPGIAESILYAMRSDGFTIAWHSTGAAGMAALARSAVDLVILDVGLPDGNGFELCRELRRTSAVPVLFLTARSSEVDRVVGLELGADDYVVKPFSPRELVARVRAILRRARGNEVGATRCGPFALDEHRQTIRYHGQPVPLSPSQYRLLAALLRRPGWVFSRAQLLDALGEGDDPSLERTVDSHIKDLRLRLRAIDPAREAIITHRGAGYALAEDW